VPEGAVQRGVVPRIAEVADDHGVDAVRCGAHVEAGEVLADGVCREQCDASVAAGLADLHGQGCGCDQLPIGHCEAESPQLRER